MDTARNNPLLLAAGAAIFLVALVHAGALAIGPTAFDYFDAQELGDALRQGARWPVALTVLVTGMFVVFAAYPLSAAGVIRPLPKLELGLLIVGGIFTLRGLGVFYFVYLVLVDSPDAIPREIGFSLVSLVLGLLVLFGRRSRRSCR